MGISQCCIVLEVGLFGRKSVWRKLEMLFIPLGWGNISLIFKIFLHLVQNMSEVLPLTSVKIDILTCKANMKAL